MRLERDFLINRQSDAVPRRVGQGREEWWEEWGDPQLTSWVRRYFRLEPVG